MDWSLYPNFSPDEFKCKETGELNMDPEFMAALQRVRDRYGRAMAISSGFRGATHSVERTKRVPGQHNKGRACDIPCWGDEAFEIVKLALQEGFTGVGVSQREGKARFIHLDMREGTPVLYSY